jgi:hypothetical protein
VSSAPERATSELSQRLSEREKLQLGALPIASSIVASTSHQANQQSEQLTNPPTAMTVDDDNDDCSMNSDELDAEWNRDDWITVPDSVGRSVPRLIEFMRNINLIN